MLKIDKANEFVSNEQRRCMLPAMSGEVYHKMQIFFEQDNFKSCM